LGKLSLIITLLFNTHKIQKKLAMATAGRYFGQLL